MGYTDGLRIRHTLFGLVLWVVLCFALTVALAVAGTGTAPLLSVAAVGAGLTMVGGLRLARAINAMVTRQAGGVERLTAGLQQVQMTAAQIAAAQSAVASDELCCQANEVASIASELLALAGTTRSRESRAALSATTGARRKPLAATDDISDFWELSNPH